MHLHIVSFPHLWLAFIRGLITIEELTADNVIFHFACSRAHLLELEEHRYPVEIGWYEKDGHLNIKFPALQFHGMPYGKPYGSVSDETIFVTKELIPLWEQLKSVIGIADARKRVDWLCGLDRKSLNDLSGEHIFFEKLDQDIPRYSPIFDKNGATIGAVVSWQTGSVVQRFLLATDATLYLGWVAGTGDRPVFNHAVVEPQGEPTWLKF